MNVYLIFSVNKSGEFFGYARMASQINDGEPLATQETGSSAESYDYPASFTGLKINVTPKTDSAPRGKIIEDEVRGTLFWEVAESSDKEKKDTEQQKSSDVWSRPFRIEWINWVQCLGFALRI